MLVTALVLGPTLVRRKSFMSGAVPNRRRRYKVIDLSRLSSLIESGEE